MKAGRLNHELGDKPMALTKKWYAVKTGYRSVPVGKPTAVDRHFDPTITLIEERIVLFRATTLDQAIQKAEKEAAQYCAESHQNPYGQSVEYRYLGECDAFELFEQPGEAREVYSRTEVVAKQSSDADVRGWLFSRESKSQSKRRRNFLNTEFSGVARGKPRV